MQKSLVFLMMIGLMMGRAEWACAQTASASSSASTAMSQPTSSSLPLFYKSVVPFSSTEHRHLTLPRQASDFSFAAHTDIVPLLASEMAQAVRHYPIVFIKDKTTSAVAVVALVGSGQGRNRFVDDKGIWRPGVYIPAWVRRYPFTMLSAANGEGVLALDPQARIFSDKRDPQALLSAEGKPTELLQKIVDFQKEFVTLSQLTERMTQALMEAEVLEEAVLSIRSAASDKPLNVQGFMVVNERKLKSLKIEQLEKLYRTDALGLAYAQLFSMSNLAQAIGAAPK